MDMGNDTTAAMSGQFGGSDDPCILGYTNGTYPNGTLGQGTWHFGVYDPSDVEVMACQAPNNPWADSMKYGLWTQYFLLAVFVLYFGVSLASKVNDATRMTGGIAIVNCPIKVSALFRLVGYPRIHSQMPTTGPLLLMTSFLVYATAICFGIRPYFRPPNFGSSPLGLRSEWIATGVVVWIFAAAARPNVLSFLTGTSQQTLFSLHKFGGYLCFYFSIIHTAAMMIRALRQAPWWYTWQTNDAYGWSAWMALAGLTWLCTMSLAPIRQLCYEIFYWAHFAGAVVFIVGMYYHLAGELGSWSYMHATVIVFGLALLARVGNVLYLSHLLFSVPQAELEHVSDDTLKATILVPSLSWRAGQHVFIRFLSVRPWETHPFTIASIPPTRRSRGQVLEFYIKRHGGITARLFSLAGSRSSTAASVPVLVDGPYGDPESIAAADHILLICGGVGFTHIGPLLLSLAKDLAAGGRIQSISLVRAVRTVASLKWGQPLIQEAFAVCEAGKLVIGCHVTGEAAGATGLSKPHWQDPSGGAEEEFKGHTGVATKRGRPHLPGLVKESVASTSGRLCVVSCGSQSMLFDVRKAVTQAQIAIIKGTAGATEVVLHEEAFGF